MTNAETTTATQTAAVGEQGAHVAPETATLRNGCRSEEGRAQGPESLQESGKGESTVKRHRWGMPLKPQVLSADLKPRVGIVRKVSESRRIQ